MVSEQLSFENISIVFLIDTDIQLLNALYFVFSYGLTGKTDAIIQMKSRNAEARINALRESKVFKNIYVLKLDTHSALERVEILIALIMPNLYMKKKHNLDLKSKYDSVFLAFSTKTFDFTIAAIGSKSIIGYDDGMGSYIGDPYHDNYKKRYILARKLFGHEYNVDTIFLNNPLCYNGAKKVSVRPLKLKLSEDQEQIINNIFNYVPVYNYPKCVFLNQPVTDIFDYLQVEKSLVDRTNDILGGHFLLRLHPSEKRSEVYELYEDKIDKTNNMWELTCAKFDSDNYVLIGCFSTAQFSPKLMNDKEPYLVFTYKIFSNLDEKRKTAFDRYINFFKGKYREKNRIFVPNNIEEYSDIIKNIKLENRKIPGRM